MTDEEYRIASILGADSVDRSGVEIRQDLADAGYIIVNKELFENMQELLHAYGGRNQ